MRTLIRAYQLFLSPLLGPNCRYQPSCSQYALEAISRHGSLRGAWFAVRRILRCHPWGGSGYDPVPDVGPAARAASTARRDEAAANRHGA